MCQVATWCRMQEQHNDTSKYTAMKGPAQFTEYSVAHREKAGHNRKTTAEKGLKCVQPPQQSQEPQELLNAA